MTGRTVYALLFLVLVPGALVAWATALDQRLEQLPRIQLPRTGVVIAAGGVWLVVSGWYTLWRHAGGLPMNAYPPPRFTRRGIYRWINDPIYVGFAAIVLGVGVASGSAAGVWVVTPFAVLASAALVMGYERPDQRRRFGGDRQRAVLSLPPDEPRQPTPGERAAIYTHVLAP